MTLVLQGTALNDEPMSQPLIGRFDERGGTLGRSDSATFTLPDPERLISRFQAQVLHRDDGYWIENVSAASPILHNGRALSAGMRVMLRDGDELRIGGYTLMVASENDEASATILRGRTVITPRESVAALRTPHTLPNIAGTAKPATATPVTVTPETPSASVTASTPALRPEGFRTPPPASQSAGAPGAPSDEALWQGFLRGAGIDFSPAGGLTPELMSTLGSMLKIAIEGIHRLVAMRATAKDEMQAEMTMIQVRGNNPLKFAPDAQVALQLLLQPPARGFLDSASALRAALIDLQSHQVGTMAGMRSALEAVLDRFDPAKLESLLTTRSVFDSLLPAHRRARLWELYLEHYRSLRGEAQEDFQRLFGEAFREAYEAQVRSLDEAYEASAPDGSKRGGRPR